MGADGNTAAPSPKHTLWACSAHCLESPRLNSCSGRVEGSGDSHRAVCFALQTMGTSCPCGNKKGKNAKKNAWGARPRYRQAGFRDPHPPFKQPRAQRTAFSHQTYHRGEIFCSFFNALGRPCALLCAPKAEKCPRFSFLCHTPPQPLQHPLATLNNHPVQAGTACIGDGIIMRGDTYGRLFVPVVPTSG